MMATAARPATPIGYRPDLDGLRAIAVGLVILDHAELPRWNAAGITGVTIFFVLSGFLITSLLREEQARTGRIALGCFYARRALRLLPAFTAVMMFVILVGIVGAWPAGWQLGVAGSVVYIQNWLYAAGVHLGPMGHTWTLSIEEQFYALWPLALVLLPIRRLTATIAVLIVAAIGWRAAFTYPMDFGPTFAHIDALLVGAAVAIWGRQVPAWIGLVALSVMLGLAFTPLAGTLEITVAATAIVIMAAPRALEPLAAAGRRSYGAYLWSWPLTMLMGVWALPATLLAAEASYRLVERPALRLKGRLARGSLSLGAPLRRRLSWRQTPEFAAPVVPSETHLMSEFPSSST
jgi:peptidoglycan/LPS O-acetylase OafA/YrhL